MTKKASRTIETYIRSHPTASLFVLFQVLLLTAALLFVFGRSGAANETAIVAFCALVIGLMVEIGVIVREKEQLRSNYYRAKRSTDSRSPIAMDNSASNVANFQARRIDVEISLIIKAETPKNTWFVDGISLTNSSAYSYME